MTFRKVVIAGLVVFGMTPFLSGCLSGGGSVDTGTPSNPNNPGGTGNNAPSISGSPPQEVLVGQGYSFAPSASDADGDPLTFSITNLPSWASFNSGNGRISGTPTLGMVGIYSNIRISVSDGSVSTSMSQFSVQVTQTSMGSATLSWNPPSQNTDGTPLTDLAAYKIYYGTSQGNYPNQVRIDNAGITTYVVDNLSPNTYYFVSTAVNGSGLESGYSNVATKVVN